jgi:hypothetical protein
MATIIISILLLICTATLICFLIFKKDYTTLAIDCDQKVCQILFDNGIRDANITSQSRLERKTFFAKWINYYIEVSASNANTAEKIVSNIKQAFEKSNVSVVISNTEAAGTLIELKLGSKILNKLLIKS